MRAAMDINEQDWTSVIETNPSGAWRVAEVAGRQMLDSGRGGSVINIPLHRKTSGSIHREITAKEMS
jgi:NAD(P)-dependent dehydrogenase (short-subunit alcohol dehydrogenase family)